jgi:hypothetical protein
MSIIQDEKPCTFEEWLTKHSFNVADVTRLPSALFAHFEKEYSSFIFSLFQHG